MRNRFLQMTDEGFGLVTYFQMQGEIVCSVTNPDLQRYQPRYEKPFD
jgi:hypothetical protein